MKILLATNKYLRRGNLIRLDSGYYSTYIPLLKLGHEVYFYDTVDPEEKSLEKVVDEFKPDLIFSCITGDLSVTPYEQLETIEFITIQGKIKTFNWFCDDTWRFDSFSSRQCWKFTCCSTPEPSYVQKYKDLGYDNILLGLWHTSSDFSVRCKKERFLGFCGHINQQRDNFFRKLQEKSINFNVIYGTTYEDMMFFYSSSACGLNFSINENDPLKKTQMKLRMMEVPAVGSLLLTEYTPGLEELYDLEKEILTFKTEEELFDKISFLGKNPSLIKEISTAGQQRFMKEHESTIRLKSLLRQIERI